jgi:hypothetical protein
MSSSIRIVNESETELLTTAFHWADEMPDWYKEFQAIHLESLESFIGSENQLFIGVFQDDLVALTRFILCPKGFYDIHLYVKRRTDPEMLFTACESIMYYLLDQGIKGLSGWIPVKHKGIVNLYRNLGFIHNGIRCFEGKVKGKIVEWLYFEKC